MDVVLLHNPGAGSGEFSADELCRLLRHCGFEPRYVSLKEKIDDAVLLHHGEFVVVAGGDGSIRKAALRLAHTHRPIAPLPLGTANNIATSLGLKVDATREIIRGWQEPSRRKLDLGTAKGPWGTERFVEGVGFGLAARVMEIVGEIAEASNHEYENTHDELHRDLSVWFALAHELTPIPLTIETDETTLRDDYLLVEVLNIPKAGPRIHLAGAASPSDAMLDLVTVTAADRATLKRAIGERFHKHTNAPPLPADRVARVLVRTTAGQVRIDDKNFDVSTDPSRKNSKPVAIEIAIEPAALEILLPEKIGRSHMP